MKNLKMENKILKIKDEEQNSFYDPQRSSNGGGYHQPYIEYMVQFNNKTYKLTIDDTSCGSFGLRFFIDLYEITTGDAITVYYQYYDEVNGNNYYKEELIGDNNAVIDFLIESEILTGKYYPNLTY